MLRRLGNKTRLLPRLLTLFPPKITTFLDLFMGSGAVTFAMVDRAKHLIANDADNDVFNLFIAVKEHQNELLGALKIMPIHEALFNHWKTQQEHNCVWRAARFLMISNFGFLGKPTTLKFDDRQPKKSLLSNIDRFFDLIQNIQFTCCDFRAFFAKIDQTVFTENVLAYADSPYLGTSDNYQHSFTEQDTQDLFALLTGSGIRFAISEFDHPLVLDLAAHYGLHVTNLGERRNLKNRRTELLITNYVPAAAPQPDLFA